MNWSLKLRFLRQFSFTIPHAPRLAKKFRQMRKNPPILFVFEEPRSRSGRTRRNAKEAAQSRRSSSVTIQLFLPALLLNYIATESFSSSPQPPPSLLLQIHFKWPPPHSPHSLPDFLRLGRFRSPVFANSHDARHNYRRDYDKSRRNYARHNHQR